MINQMHVLDIIKFKTIINQRTFGVCGVSKSRSFLKVLCGGVSGQSGIGELDPSPSSWT